MSSMAMLCDEERRVLDHMLRHGMVEAGGRVLAGVSGGADSVCLLLILLRLRERLDISIHAVHVHHGMRQAAECDLEFVRGLCGDKGISCAVRRVDVPSLERHWGASPEEAARRARYEAFAEVAGELGARTVALAHHRDDQAETVLLSLFRGAGLKGMSGIAPVSPMPFGDGRIKSIRPLLVLSRQETEGYLRACGQEHRDDESNATDDYARNRVRHHILSYASSHINQRVSEHIASAADRAREAFEFIDSEARSRLEQCSDGGSVDIKALATAPTAIRRQMIMILAAGAGLVNDLTQTHLESIEGLIVSDASGGGQRIDLPQGFVAERIYGRLHIHADPGGEPTPSDHPNLSIRVIDAVCGAEIPTDPFTKWFDYDTIKSGVCVRKRMQGDWIDVGNGTKSLSKELKDERIPSGKRDCLTLLAAGSEILWIVGHRRCESHKVTDSTKRIMEASLEGEVCQRE